MEDALLGDDAADQRELLRDAEPACADGKDADQQQRHRDQQQLVGQHRAQHQTLGRHPHQHLIGRAVVGEDTGLDVLGQLHRTDAVSAGQ